MPELHDAGSEPADTAAFSHRVEYLTGQELQALWSGFDVAGGA